LRSAARRWWFGALALASAAGGRGEAQGAPWLPRLRLANDAYNFWKIPALRPDEEYTNGVAIGFESLRGTWWSRRLSGVPRACRIGDPSSGLCVTTHVGIGQDIYTPDLARPPFAVPDWEDERPYAAWLYVTGAAHRVSPRALRVIDVSLGVVGPAALGEFAQGVAHRINRGFTERAEGWETQVGGEPGLLIGVRQQILALRLATGEKGMLDLAPFAGAVLGNVRTGLDLGGRLRLGYNLSHPWDPRAWRGRPPVEFFATAGGRMGYVARDFSLDGTLLRGGRRVERVPVVPEYEFGLGLRLHALSLGWTATTRGREYRTGPRHHSFSAMTAAWELVR
jgi:hypothetical protein